MSRRRRNDPVADLVILVILASIVFRFIAGEWNDVIVRFAEGFAATTITAGIIILIVSYALKKRRQAKLLALELIDADNMTGREFEKFMAEVFRKRGYKVKETSVSGDYGVDLVVKKDGVTSAVQLA